MAVVELHTRKASEGAWHEIGH